MGQVKVSIGGVTIAAEADGTRRLKLIVTEGKTGVTTTLTPDEARRLIKALTSVYIPGDPMSEVINRIDSIRNVFPEIGQRLNDLRHSINNANDVKVPKPIGANERQAMVMGLDELASIIGGIADIRDFRPKKAKS